MILHPTKGHLLVAEPSILDDYSFNRSVILLADHSEAGSVGFILNKPLDYRLSDIVNGAVDSLDIPIYNGGPVDQDNLYFIHTVPHLIEGSQEIACGIYWGGNFERAIDLLINGKIGSDSIKFFLGYSGWDAQQLSDEVEMHSWVVLENQQHVDLIKENSPALWREKLLELGGEYLLWSNAPENPQYN